MVSRSGRGIAVYNGEPDDTRNTIEYATPLGINTLHYKRVLHMKDPFIIQSNRTLGKSVINCFHSKHLVKSMVRIFNGRLIPLASIK